MSPLRRIHGLDHKCITCGSGYGAHVSPEFLCPGRDDGAQYRSKGPQPSLAFRAALEEFEAIGIRMSQEDAGDDYVAFVETKKHYKAARLRILQYVQDLERGV